MKAARTARQRRAPAVLTHLDERGRARMVDVSAKAVTVRRARARAELHVAAATVHALRSGSVPKGNAIEVARLAGIQATKWTAHLIPLCHPLRVAHAQVEIDIASDRRVVITASVTADDRTGVEMEALTAVSVAALAFYDMVKAIDRGMVIERIELLEKLGGKTGHWRRPGRVGRRVS